MFGLVIGSILSSRIKNFKVAIRGIGIIGIIWALFLLAMSFRLQTLSGFSGSLLVMIFFIFLVIQGILVGGLYPSECELYGLQKDFRRKKDGGCLRPRLGGSICRLFASWYPTSTGAGNSNLPGIFNDFACVIYPLDVIIYSPWQDKMIIRNDRTRWKFRCQMTQMNADKNRIQNTGDGIQESPHNQKPEAKNRLLSTFYPHLFCTLLIILFAYISLTLDRGGVYSLLCG